MKLRLNIPVVGELFNFDVRRGQVSTTTPRYYAFQLNTTKNHIDGAVSRIIFQMKYVGGKSKLVVDAFIVKDFWAGNGVYKAGASLSWQQFANNLGKV